MWKRGKGVFSSTTTRNPFRASAIAAVAPPGPPPMITTSYCGWAAAGIAAWLRRDAGRAFDLDKQVRAAQVGLHVLDVSQVRHLPRNHARHHGPVRRPDVVDAEFDEPAKRVKRRQAAPCPARPRA